MTEEQNGTDVGAEVKAMGTVGDALQRLDQAARQRVLDWAAERFALTQKRTNGTRNREAQSKPIAGGGTSNNTGDLSNGEFESISDLFEAAGPSTGADRALVAGYWFQCVKGEENFAGQQINDELKHMGHGLSNVTRTLTDLAEKSPSQVRQVQKVGKSKQGRKKYKLTTEGEKTVKKLLRGEAPNESGSS